ncbi:sulfur carrier protein ThiS [Microbacterium sp. LTA6]|uniref:sulfur carrier protein ThiS n=1 Tax=Microbacterium sp. LTA6 TaxID=3129771 RepID=UPI0032472ED4
MIDVRLNGAPARIAPDATVADVVTDLTGRAIGADGRAADGESLGLAVAVNAAIVRRGSWTTTVLSTGDEIEVLTAVQGG